MATKRTRRTHARALDWNTRAHLQLGTGMNHWTLEETERYRAAWNQHGRQLLEECDRNGSPEPMAMLEFGPPEDGGTHD